MPPKLSNLKENHLQEVLLIKHVDKEKHTHTENKVKSKFIGYQGDLSKGLAIIEAL